MVSIDKGDVVSILAGLETISVGFITTLNQTAAKINVNATLEQKVTILLSRIVGPEIAQKLTGVFAGNVPAGYNLMGPLNPSTFGGGAILVFDMLASHYGAGKMGYSKVRRFVQALGLGLFVGGLVGGLLDPPDNGNGRVINMTQNASGQYEMPRRLW